MIINIEFKHHKFSNLIGAWRVNGEKWYQVKNTLVPEQYYIIAKGLPESAETDFDIYTGQELKILAHRKAAKTNLKNWFVDEHAYSKQTSAEKVLQEEFGLIRQTNN
ncbi:MAG: hypothetical protein WCW02_00920 [Candidatus Buchananbacteria bacterium]